MILFTSLTSLAPGKIFFRSHWLKMAVFEKIEWYVHFEFRGINGCFVGDAFDERGWYPMAPFISKFVKFRSYEEACRCATYREKQFYAWYLNPSDFSVKVLPSPVYRVD
jgi:hypothetical protein